MVNRPSTLESAKWSLNGNDIAKWARNLVIFSIPALAVLQTGLINDNVVNWELAAGMAIQALAASLIDLGKNIGSGY
jgi:hypothetical protein